MAGMWVVHVDVKDDEKYGDYIQGSSEVVAAHDGEFIARGGRYEQKETASGVAAPHSRPVTEGTDRPTPRLGVSQIRRTYLSSSPTGVSSLELI